MLKFGYEYPPLEKSNQNGREKNFLFVQGADYTQ
jgi:hypothetical protein